MAVVAVVVACMAVVVLVACMVEEDLETSQDVVLRLQIYSL
jgi:hypothetical protein